MRTLVTDLVGMVGAHEDAYQTTVPDQPKVGKTASLKQSGNYSGPKISAPQVRPGKKEVRPEQLIPMDENDFADF
jgi:hypothetical protein